MPPKTEKFLRGVRRRIALVRVIESIGVACLAASALGSVLVIASIWRGQSAFGIAAGFLALGFAAGLLWGFTRIPSTLAAAAEADRQLGLHDLLATLLLSRTNDLTWMHAVAAMAEDRCARFHPREVVVAKFGLRAWSGIGLSAALLLTLSLFSGHPTELR